MMQKYITIFLSLLLLLSACTESKKEAQKQERKEDLAAKKRFQGIWVDRETGNVLFKAQGDSIYYPDTVNVPVRFWIYNDTLYLSGDRVTAYPIDHMGEYLFSFHSLMGDVVSLQRSESQSDTLYFVHKNTAPITYNQVVRKDTVVFYNDERYHCYVYVNPSKQKVYKTSYTEEGMAVENAYYDNVIHICVYHGRQRLYGRDYDKNSFKGLVPDNFLSQSILSNMEFDKVDADGFHFNATVCIPDDASCYMICILVDFNGKVTTELIEY